MRFVVDNSLMVFAVIAGRSWRLDGCYELEVYLGRDDVPEGDESARACLRLVLGRAPESVIDLGGRWWVPRARYFRSLALAHRVYRSQRWTGRDYEFAGIDWPIRLRCWAKRRPLVGRSQQETGA